MKFYQLIVACSSLLSQPSYSSSSKWNNVVSKSWSLKNNRNIRTNQFDNLTSVISSKLRAPTADCHEKIWPNFSWPKKQMQILFLSENSQQAKLWHHSLSTPIDYDFNKVPNEAKGYYGFLEIDNKPTVAINLDYKEIYYPNLSDEEYAYDSIELIIHEAFHAYWQTQPNWKSHHQETKLMPRGDFYPIKWEPRYYRNLMEKNVFQSLNSSNSQLFLEQAEASYYRWIEHAPLERLNYTDRNEGSAEYVGIMGSTIARLGCHATQDQLIDVIKKNHPNRTIDKLDRESYSIGLYTGLALDQVNDIKWKENVNNGLAPYEVLFGLQPRNFILQEDLGLQNAIKDAIQYQAESSEVKMQPFAQKILNAETYFIGIPYWNSQSMTVESFYIMSILGIPEQIILLREQQRLFEDNKEFVIKPNTPYFSNKSSINPCGTFYYVVLDKNPLTDQSDIIQYEDENIKISASLNFKDTIEGRKFICIK